MGILWFLTVVVSVGAMAFYLWYLTWPKVEGEVLDIQKGTYEWEGGHFGSGKLRLDRLTTPRPYCLISYSFEFDGKSHTSARQGLIVTNGLGVKKSARDKMTISVCKNNTFWSCPYRPIYEFFVSLSFMAVIAMPAVLLEFLY